MRLHGSGRIRNAAIDDLGNGYTAILSKEVEGLRLDAGPLHLLPLEVIPGEFRVRRLFGLFGDGSNGRGAVDGLLGAGHVGESVKMSG